MKILRFVPTVAAYAWLAALTFVDWTHLKSAPQYAPVPHRLGATIWEPIQLGGDLTGTTTVATANKAAGNVGGVFGVTSPVTIGAGPFPAGGTALRLPWAGASGVTKVIAQHDRTAGPDRNLIGTSSDFGDQIAVGDPLFPNMQLFSGYVQAMTYNEFDVYSRAFAFTDMAVGANGGGPYMWFSDGNQDMHVSMFHNGALSVAGNTLNLATGNIIDGTTPEVAVTLTGFELVPVSVPITTGTATLSAAQYQPGKIDLTGTLTGDVTVVWPSTAADGTCWLVDPTALTLAGHAVTASINGHAWGTTIGNVNLAHLCYNGTKFYGAAYAP